MKESGLIIIITIWLFSNQAFSQVTQLELASGLDKTDFTYYSIKPISKTETFSVSTLAFFQKYHHQEDTPFDELGVQANAFWNISKSVAIGPSLYHNSVAGFSERLSLQFSTQSERLILTAIPSIANMELTDYINGELFIQAQFSQPIDEQWSLLVSSLMLTHWDKFSEHARSFQQLRVGLSVKATQFGIAADFDQYGPEPVTKTSFGLFARRILINN